MRKKEEGGRRRKEVAYTTCVLELYTRCVVYIVTRHTQTVTHLWYTPVVHTLQHTLRTSSVNRPPQELRPRRIWGLARLIVSNRFFPSSSVSVRAKLRCAGCSASPRSCERGEKEMLNDVSSATLNMYTSLYLLHSLT